MPKLSIIYVNYNTEQLLLDSIASVQKQLTSLPHEIIVVDNNSEAFNPQAVTKLAPKATVIVNPDNLGFGAANNLGASKAKGEYLFILNTDTLIPAQHKLTDLIDFLDTNPDYAAALPLLTDEAGTVQPTQVAYFPSPKHILLNVPVRLAAKVLSANRLYGRINMDYLTPGSQDVDVAVAAALVVRKGAFEQVGGFSKQYFMFYEDSDLCRKLHAADYKVRWFAAAHVIHLWGKSITGNKSFTRRKKLYFAAQDTYLKSWHGVTGRLAVKLLRAPLTLRYILFNR